VACIKRDGFKKINRMNAHKDPKVPGATGR